MKARNVLRALMIFSLLALLLVVAAPAQAKEPIFWEETGDDTWTIDGPCDFPIIAHEISSSRTIIFFNKEGIPTRAVSSYPNFKQTWSANGKTINVLLMGPVHTEILSVDSDEIVIMLGPIGLMPVPGYGIVQGFAGNATFRYQFNEETGEWEITELYRYVGTINEENWDPICEYLAP